MKTYTIEGATHAPRFTEKFWFTAATVRAKNKAEALKEFRDTIKRGTDLGSDNVTWTNSDAPDYVSYRVKLQN
jgi:hypothetical protein